MSVTITPYEREVMDYYNIHNFSELIQVYNQTRDRRLERVVAASHACLTAMSEYYPV